MNCRRIEEIIPLYVEGDLEIDRAELVSAHLKSCDACSRLAGGFNASQEWLRSYVPPAFDSAFFDGLRNGVLARIDNEKARPSFFQLIAARWRWEAVLTAAALMVAIGGLIFYAYHRGPGTTNREIVRVQTPPEVPAHHGPENHGDEDPQRVAQAAPKHRHSSLRDAVAKAIEPADPESIFGLPWEIENSTASEVEGNSVTQADSTQTETQPSEEVEPTRESMTRIEIQTSDPTIRIIWFAPNNVDKNSGRRSTDT